MYNPPTRGSPQWATPTGWVCICRGVVVTRPVFFVGAYCIRSHVWGPLGGGSPQWATPTGWVCICRGVVVTRPVYRIMFVVEDNLPNRKHIRLETWDYSNPWWYFVTICTEHMRHMFGTVSVGVGSPHPVMELNDFGNIVNNWWYEIPNHFNNVTLDEWQIMPNHVHGIIQINSNHGRGNHAPTTLGQIVGYYKYQSTKQFNAIVGAGSSRPNPKMWQRGYYDRVIRNDRELDRIRTYIRTNPQNWLDDEYF